MSATQQPTPNHQSETFGSGQTQYFECEVLSEDHPEVQARERARQQQENRAPTATDENGQKRPQVD